MKQSLRVSSISLMWLSYANSVLQSNLCVQQKLNTCFWNGVMNFVNMTYNGSRLRWKPNFYMELPDISGQMFARWNSICQTVAIQTNSNKNWNLAFSEQLMRKKETFYLSSRLIWQTVWEKSRGGNGCIHVLLNIWPQTKKKMQKHTAIYL